MRYLHYLNSIKVFFFFLILNVNFELLLLKEHCCVLLTSEKNSHVLFFKIDKCVKNLSKLHKIREITASACEFKWYIANRWVSDFL